MISSATGRLMLGRCDPPLTDYDAAPANEHPMPDVLSPPGPKMVSKSKTAKAPDQGLKRTRVRVKPKPHPAAVTAYIPYVSPFAIGDHISHPQFGEGAVTKIDDAKLTINFASRGTKQIIDYYVKRREVG